MLKKVVAIALATSLAACSSPAPPPQNSLIADYDLPVSIPVFTKVLKDCLGSGIVGYWSRNDCKASAHSIARYCPEGLQSQCPLSHRKTEKELLEDLNNT